MKRYPLILIAAMLLWGCVKEDLTVCASRNTVPLILEVQPDRMMTVTRSADETAIRDVNFYLCDKNGNIILHRYQTSATLRFECAPANYLMRIAANMGRDLGNNPAREDFTLAHKDAYDVLPMAWEDDVTIPASGGRLPAVEVQRAVAKISYDITVKPADMELLSVQLLSVPRTVSIFDVAASPSDDPDDYTDCPKTTLSGRSAAGTSYLLPNMQGRVPSITDQRDKNPGNAPENASYLLIRAKRGDKILTYTVYLGENNTSDFNVRANVHYRFNISILGDNEVDTRISSYTLRVWDDFDDYNYGGYCLLDGTRYLHVEVECNDATAPSRGRLELLSGDLSGFTFDYGNSGAIHNFDLYDMMGDNTYEMEYYMPGYTEENSLLAYRITLTDAYGFSQTYDFEHRMANAAIVHTEGGGDIIVEGELYHEREAEGMGERITALCMDACALTAEPAAGYTFDGWYQDAGYDYKITDEPSYVFIPSAPLRHVYALFLPGEIQLDAHNTANSYIAPQLLCDYSFDATVQGNGSPTLSITPQPLSGAYARLIWESGTRANSIIASLSYDGRRISFRTGSQQGNALIGLFDAWGNCIWSWHIWVTSYNPDTSAHTYASGAVFMDRNLGAIGTDYMQSAACGLYYQWGRKDPFPYPASFSSNRQASFVYHDRFRYEVIHPENSDPADVMTVDWAVKNPTSFIYKADYDVEIPEEDVLDWLLQPHHNLWGNTTQQGNNISKVCRKTIYDPCPPGWRVPDACDFEGIEPVRKLLPYYIEIIYNGTRTARYPASGTLGGDNYSGVGAYGQVYTNTPYFWNFDKGPAFFDGVSCTSIYLMTDLRTTKEFRYQANAVRCIKE